MNILIVGGAGYIGSHMVNYLRVNTSHQITVLDNLDRGHRKAVFDTELIIGDYGDLELVKSVIEERKITALIHFGADSQVGESVIDPEKYYHNNVVKGKILVDAAIAGGVKYIIFSSTAATYGEPKSVPIKEEDPTIPTNPYGRTKLAFEGLLESYRVAYGISYTCLRYFNACGADPSGAIGEDHSPESHLLPIVLEVALGKRNIVKIFGDDYQTDDGTCIRDYIHVNDLSSAHLLALDKIASGGESGIYNLGNGTGFSVKNIIDVCRKVTGHAIPIEIVPRRAGDPALLIATADKAKKVLGWKPEYIRIEQIVETAWKWHSSHPNGYGDKD